MHGYQIIQQLAERSGGVWRASPGSIYPTLSQLTDEGLVQMVSEGGRNVAHLSEGGVAFVNDHRDELGQPWDDVAGSVKDEAVDVRDEIGALMAAVQQVIRIGDAKQVAKAAKLLSSARRNLYLLLAESAEADDGDEPAAAEER